MHPIINSHGFLILIKAALITIAFYFTRVFVRIYMEVLKLTGDFFFFYVYLKIESLIKYISQVLFGLKFILWTLKALYCSTKYLLIWPSPNFFCGYYVLRKKLNLIIKPHLPNHIWV